MAIVTTRDELINYALRRLGEPVTKVNVALEQISDCVDDAIQYFHEFHADATEQTFWKYTITQQDIDNEYIPVPSDVLSIIRVLPLKGDLLSAEAQYALNALQYRESFDLVDFELFKQNMKLVSSYLRRGINISFERHMERVRLYYDFSAVVPDETVFIFEVIRMIDPDVHTSAYNDIWLKQYVTELIKRQWGENLKKFSGVQLPGGIELDGKTIYEEAVNRIKELEEEIETKYTEPLGFEIG